MWIICCDRKKLGNEKVIKTESAFSTEVRTKKRKFQLSTRGKEIPERACKCTNSRYFGLKM